MCSARRLIVLYICVMFREYISDGIRAMERTRMVEALTERRMDTQNFDGYKAVYEYQTRQTLFRRGVLRSGSTLLLRPVHLNILVNVVGFVLE